MLRYVYWTDWGEKSSSIERISMDGALETREKIISEDITWPNGLTLDLIQKRLYWIDAKLRRLEVADFDGKNRKLLVNSGTLQPFFRSKFRMLIFLD